MSLHITHRDIAEAHRYARDAMDSAKGYGKRDGLASRAVDGLTKGVMTCAGAAAAGFLTGYKGTADATVEGKKIPLDFLAGLAFKGGAVFLEDSTIGNQLDNFGTGVLSAFIARYTVGLGASMASKAPAASKPSAIAGDFMHMLTGGLQAPAPLTKDELATMAMQIR